jgi:hypothetical protein
MLVYYRAKSKKESKKSYRIDGRLFFHRDPFDKLSVAFHENQQFARFVTNPSSKERQTADY